MARYEGDGARYEGDAERRRPRLRVSKSVQERKREHRGVTRDISAAGAAVLAGADIDGRAFARWRSQTRMADA
jgi:hypothetical protein